MIYLLFVILQYIVLELNNNINIGMKNITVWYFVIIAAYVAISVCSQQIKTNKLKLYKTRAQSYVTRLHPGSDIMVTLTQLLSHRKHRAITITAATGSVLHCHVRFANVSSLNYIAGPLQITSITGTFDRYLKPHLHIAFGDREGIGRGGHLPSINQRKNAERQKNIQNNSGALGLDCPIFTTLQLSLILYKDVIFQRKIDPETTYDELTIMQYTEPYWKRFLSTEDDEQYLQQ